MKPLDALVRVEWLALGAAAIVAFSQTGESWWLFALLILAPDLSMLGYLGGPRAGAACYNALHWLALPALLVAAGYFASQPLALAVGLIWLAHIAIDRMLGYGLKHATSFQDTHLGRIGRG